MNPVSADPMHALVSVGVPETHTARNTEKKTISMTYVKVLVQHSFEFTTNHPNLTNIIAIG